MHESSESCAEIVQTTSKESVSNMATFPSVDILPESRSRISNVDGLSNVVGAGKAR